MKKGILIAGGVAAALGCMGLVWLLKVNKTAPEVEGAKEERSQVFTPWSIAGIGPDEILAPAAIKQTEFMYSTKDQETGKEILIVKNMVTGSATVAEEKMDRGEEETEYNNDDINRSIQIALGEIDEKNISHTAVSPDGTTIAFTFSRGDENNTANVLALVKQDGTGYKVLREGDDAERLMPFFAPAGDTVLYFVKAQGRVMLSFYHLPTGRFARMVTLPVGLEEWQSPTWTDDELLAITGIAKNQSGKSEEGRLARVLVMDLKRDALVYASPLISEFHRFIRFRDMPLGDSLD